MKLFKCLNCFTEKECINEVIIAICPKCQTEMILKEKYPLNIIRLNDSKMRF